MARRNLSLMIARRRPVLDLDDRLVVGVEQDRRAARSPRGRPPRRGRESASRRCRERSPTCAWRPARRVPALRLLQAVEHLLQRLAHLRGHLGKSLGLQLSDAGFLEIAELFEELDEAEIPLQRAEELLDAFAVRLARAQRAAKQGEAPVDAGLLAGDARGGAVVRTRIGDAASDDVLVVVEQHGLRRGRAEVDADERAHGLFL